ncbi:bZIP transcription factor 53-like [Punica granatum]|uniref:BZIP domain-containing protein n=2 Tax=Punica granatum TaxID=22663 RepID=A0A218X6R2_PUNGR|nr:bZIP transcription factor 53-like [Punica granatum]OWM80062.1 hypothetical protein CDL15_Pgr010040 [Punica granatum]PKI70291.1 hypothetical protein CRG98_009320 [Punica granatum]
MASAQSRSSSGSDSDPRPVVCEERKRKRMESNRESARRSRLKKQKLLDDLLGQVSQLKNENSQLVQSIEQTSQRFDEVELKNNVLRAQVVELTERLVSLNSVLQIMEQVSGLAIDIPEIPDMLMNPWQLPCPVQQPIMASVDRSRE